MTQKYWVALLLAATLTQARAGGYSDFSAGLAARNRGDYSEAIRLFTNAINASDLSKQLLSGAYFDRESGAPELVLSMNVIRRLHMYIAYHSNLLFLTAAEAH